MVQQTLTDANESFATFRGDSLPELFVWLAAILNHNVSDAVRQHLLAGRRTVKIECHLDDSSQGGSGWDGLCAADQTSPSMAVSREELQVRLSAAIESLPPRQREAVRLRHLEGRPLASIAGKLGCTVPAAAAVIARGLHALRDTLRDLD
jgi:RNA polymerase sigma-70 factor (ECF subfamily)